MVVIVGGTEEMNIGAVRGVAMGGVRYLKVDS
jgi:hypothetical protein